MGETLKICFANDQHIGENNFANMRHIQARKSLGSVFDFLPSS